MPIRFLLLVLGLSLALPAHAEVRRDLADPAVAATLNGEPVSARLLDLMHRLARHGDPAITPAATLQALIDDRLVASQARASVPAGELIEDNKVAFSPAMQVEQAMVANLETGFIDAIRAAVRKEKGGNLDGVILAEHRPTAAQWTAVFGPPSTGLQLEYSLDDKALAAADKVVVLRYRIGKDAPAQITLRDVYVAQNVQGRAHLHGRDATFTLSQARLLLRDRYVLRWARTVGLGEADFAVFQRAMEDHLVHGGWMAYLGVAADIHDTPEHLRTLAAAVTPEEVRAYYDQHRDEFRRIEKVRARSIQVRDEATADDIAARLHKGESFAELARRYSQGPEAASGGDLGWILHGEKAHGWLDSLVFLQQPGVPSKPVRSPGAPGEKPVWDIVLVEERVEGWQPADSESVRYVAGQAIARQKALQEYRGTVERLRREADIHLNPVLLPMALPQEGKGS